MSPFLYSGTSASLAADIEADRLLPGLETEFESQLGHRPSPAERTSWANSLAALATQLLAADLARTALVLEYMLPLTSKRMDALLFGADGEGHARAVAVELKQWDRVRTEDVDGCVVAQGPNLVLHPRCQICQYTDYLEDFNQMVHSGAVEVDGAAFLHASRSGPIAGLRVDALGTDCTCGLYAGDQDEAFRAFLTSRLRGADGTAIRDDFVNAPTRPSKKLLDHLVAEIEGNEAFTLLDEQLVAFETVKRAVDEADRSGQKSAVVVAGGPGTGKSVIAARLLGHFAKKGYNISHATGSRSFTRTLRKRVGPRAAGLFRYFNSFLDADESELDVLICDEAHRIRETSNSRWTAREKRTDIPQVIELMNVARVTVFLLDENQIVRPDEMGSVAGIKAAAAKVGADAPLIDLNGQFRCMGSDTYVRWAQSLLGLHAESANSWDPDGSGFELETFDSPQDLEDWLAFKIEEGATARLTAGFCWPWSNPKKDGGLVDDVEIDGWRRPWNAKPDKKVKGVPEAAYWASEPGGFDQVGCIYTAQGFEFDYAGVIMGGDYVYRDGDWVCDPKEHKDPALRRTEDIEPFIRNVYKVLLTRGLKGCGIYSTDDETRRHLHILVRSAPSSPRRAGPSLPPPDRSPRAPGRRRSPRSGHR